jgi:hypothetical protein
VASFIQQDDATSRRLGRKVYEHVRIAHTDATGVDIRYYGDSPEDDDKWVQEATDKQFHNLKPIWGGLERSTISKEFPMVVLGKPHR